jgi:hypothetical protein
MCLHVYVSFLSCVSVSLCICVIVPVPVCLWCVGVWVGGWAGGWVGGWVDGRVCVCVCVCVCVSCFCINATVCMLPPHVCLCVWYINAHPDLIPAKNKNSTESIVC